MEYNLPKKKPESLCSTPETNTILYINYTSIKKKKEMGHRGEGGKLED